MARRPSHSSLSLLQKQLIEEQAENYDHQNLLKNHPELNQYYVGVDVGTGSARACIIDSTGNILAMSERAIIKEILKPNFITQSSTEIWNAICHCVKSVVRESEIDPYKVHGIGFDATCSLVVVDENTGAPVGAGPDFTNDNQNIILWMDHRAMDETAKINSTNHKVLKYVGGQMSVEMEIPKIKWLKDHMAKETYGKCEFYDLPDYLTFKATNQKNRSFCSTVCKQGLLPPGVEGSIKGWSQDFLTEIGLEDLTANDFQKLGGDASKTFKSAGEVVGVLSPESALQLGLTTNCVVGSGVIDAYAGWVGTVAAKTDFDLDPLVHLDNNEKGIAKATGRLAAVAGTSTCHIAMTKDPVFVNGVWGPYRDVMAKDFWLAEGGQSCTGALLAHVLSTHPAFTELATQSDTANVSRFDFLNSRLEMLTAQKGARSVVALAKHLFFYGDYHGNRSPIADPNMRAAIIGQSMDNSIDDLAILYLPSCEFIAQQTRQIVEKMCASGHEIKAIFMSGGQCRNGLLMRLLADCTNLPIVIPRYIDSAVVFGSALLGAVASKCYDKDPFKKSTNAERRASLTEEQPPLPTKSHFAQFAKAAGYDLNEGAHSPSPYTMPTASSTSGVSSGFPFPHVTPASQMALNKKTSAIAEEEEVTSPKTSTSNEALSFNSVNHQKSVSDLLAGDLLWDVMYNLTGAGKVVKPNSSDHPDRKLLNAKYEIFLDMAKTQRDYRTKVDELEKQNA